MKTLLKKLALCAGLMLTLSQQADAANPVNPKLDWQVYETANFRIHYTPAYWDWVENVAHEMELARDTLAKQQSRTLSPKVDVVVFDPLNDSNGFALPFSTKPFMALYTTPPLSDSVISNSSSWPQLLALHEYVHLLHLGQPDRSAWRQTLREIYDLFDIYSSNLPRWVAEGYATLMESKLTGRGRLYDVQVEAILLQFAREGALPSYSALSSTDGGYKQGAMAYLVGSRFLAWLEQEYSEQTLDAVWTRLRGSANRGFDRAFTGVFQQSPSALYRRFVAQYTQRALNSENNLEASTLWLDAAFELKSPSLSPDGSKLVVVEKARGDSGILSLNVYETQANKKAKEDFEKRNKEILAADPVDIVDAEPLVFNPKRLHSLNSINGKGVSYPRWRGDKEVLYIASSYDKHGASHKDLFSWQIETGKVRQLTTGLNIRRFDVSSDGNTLVAERNEFGKSSLISLNLEATEVQGSKVELIAGGLEAGFDFPRINPQNPKQLAYLSRKNNQPWQLNLATLEQRERLSNSYIIPMPKDYQFLSFPNWTPDGDKLLFVAGKGDALITYQYHIEHAQLTALSDGSQHMAWPMLWTDNATETEKEAQSESASKVAETRLLYASVRSTGPNLYHRPYPEGERVSQLSSGNDWQYLEALSPAEIKMPKAGHSNENAKGESVRYNSWQGVGRQEMSMFFGGTASSASTNLWELGVKGGDLMQRLKWLVNVGFDDAVNGANGYVSWHGWPVDISGNLYYFELDPIKQATEVNAASGEFAGFNLALAKDYGMYSGWLETYRGQFGLQLHHNERQVANYGVEEQQVAVLSHRQSWIYDDQIWGGLVATDLNWLQGQSEAPFLAGKDSWSGHQGSVKLGVAYRGFNLKGEQSWLVRKDHEYGLVRMGGLESILLSSRNLPNWVFIPELPFASRTGDEFSRTTLSLSHNGGMELYISELSLDDKVEYDIVGVRGKLAMDMFRVGLSGIRIEYGLADVVNQQDEHKVQGWLNLRYQY